MVYNLCILFSNLNSSTTVEGDRRELIYTTITLGSDVAAVDTHLLKFTGNSLGTLFRQPLVVCGLTRSTISITVNEELGVVLLCILSKSLYVYEVLLRSDVGLVEVEEYRDRSLNEFLNSCGSFSLGLVGKHVAETIVLCISIVELVAETIDFVLILSLQSVNIRNLVPSSLAKVEDQTYLSIEVVVVTIPTTVCTSYKLVTIDVTLKAVPTTFKIDVEKLAHLPCRLDTCTEVHGIEVVSHGTANATTNERNYIPHTILVVTHEQVAQVEHDVLVENPVLVTIAGIVIVGYSLTPNTLHLGTKTETGSEPLTDGKSSTGIGTELLDRA